MKPISRLTILIIIAVFISSCFPGRKVPENTTILPLSDTTTIRQGSIVYGLPRTVFTVNVEMERTIEKPGPYARFAEDLLGLDKVILSESESWSIQRITVRSSVELDPSEFYVIESNSLFQTNVLALKKEGLILDINPGVYDNSDIYLEDKNFSTNQYNTFDLGSDEYFQLQRDTAFKRVNIDSSFIRIPYIVEKKKKLTIDQLAEKAARRLMEMREGKHLILTGEANVFPQSEAAINEINRLEKEYTELFTGKTRTENRILSFQIIPDKEMIGKPLTIFLFSEVTGQVSGTAKGGIPVKLELIPEQKIKDLTIINKQQTEVSPSKYDKLFYRVPDVVNAKISSGSEILYNSRKLIYQFGEIIQLPANYIIGR